MSTHIEADSGGVERIGPKERLFVERYAETGDVAVASLAAGIRVETGRGWIREGNFSDAVHAIRERLLRTKGASVGFRVLLQLADDEKVPAHVRRAAAKDLLGLGGHSEGAAAADAAARAARKGLEDMTADELERYQAAAAATLAQLRRQAGTVDVVPDPPIVTPRPRDPRDLF